MLTQLSLALMILAAMVHSPFSTAESLSAGLQDNSDSVLVPIKMGISMSIPPWVIKKDNAGIELDILKASLDSRHYTIDPVYLPFARAYLQFDSGQLDGVINANETVSSVGYLSDTVVVFQNVAISLAHKNFPEKFPIEFLTDKLVIAFQKAQMLLGPEFLKMARQNPDYLEIAEQNRQIAMLFARDVDFIVIDKSIFGYFWDQSKKNGGQPGLDLSKSLRFHPVFKPSPYPFLFKDQQVRDDFNRGLSRIKASGEFDRIIKKYDHLSDLYRTGSKKNRP